MIRLACVEDETQIRLLWKASFGDSDDYISFFFKQLKGTYTCFVKEENEAIVSMLFLLNCTFAGKRGKYIFAACTNADHQGRGHMGQLLHYIINQTKTTTDFLCLVPSSHSLFDYYGKVGFMPYFYNTVVEFEIQKQAHIAAKPITFSAFYERRSRAPSAVQWDLNESHFLFEENLWNGGRNCITSTGYAILREANDRCEVIEWVSDTYEVAELESVTHCKHLRVRAPVIGVPHLNGMLYILNPESDRSTFEQISHPYLSLVLD